METIEQLKHNFLDTAKKLINKYQIPGTAIGIAKEGQIVYEEGVGYRNIAEQKPVTMDTIFGIASVTKSFICVGIMQLQEEGKLHVHDPIVKYLPNFKLKASDTEKMTIHHLMTHSTGLPPLPTLFYANRKSREIDPAMKDYPGLTFKTEDAIDTIENYDQLLDFIATLDFELLGEPGKEFSYSNDSYALLGAIIDKVSGKSLETYLEERIFRPANMQHSFVLPEQLENQPNVTSLYASRKTDNGEEVYEAPIWWDSPAMRGAGAIKSTINDMLKYAEIFRTFGKVGNSRILSEESVRAMIKPHIACAPGKFYGYGLIITPDYYGGTLVEHSGNSKAIASQLSIIPERGVTGMVLTNLAGVPAPTILQGALNVYEGREFTANIADVDMYTYTETELAGYKGTYTSNEGMSLYVQVKEGKLEFTVPSHDESVVAINIDKDIFQVIIKDQIEVVRFIREGGKIDRIAYHFRQFPKENN